MNCQPAYDQQLSWEIWQYLAGNQSQKTVAGFIDLDELQT